MRWFPIKVTAFSADRFRNIEALRLTPCDGINVVCGENGQGKTNLLEAIGLFTGAKSFRGAQNNKMIMRGAEFARLELSFSAQQRDQRAAMTITPQDRMVTLNDVKQPAASALMGRLCAVIFSPDRMSLVTGGGNERRRFIDAAITQSAPGFMSTLFRFNQIIKQRNTLLKDMFSEPSLESTLDVWDVSIASYAAAVAVRRAGFVQRLSAIATRLYDGISSGREPLWLEYNCSFADIPQLGDLNPNTQAYRDAVSRIEREVSERYIASLAENRRNDVRLGYTFNGPQRDDMDIFIGEGDARSYGSQGQKRSAVLALKLAEAELLSQLIGEQPIALLDDVMSELDASRQAYLLNKLSGWQVFITCCDPAPLRLLNKGSIFIMNKGCLSEMSEVGSDNKQPKTATENGKNG